MSPDQISLGFLIVDVAKLMRRSFEKHLAGNRLPLSQARTLIYVAKHQDCRQVDLADMLEIKPITLARLIDKLELADLVERRRDPNDRRAYRLFLRPKAEAELSTVALVAEQTRRQALRNLSSDEAQALVFALRHVRTNLSA
ncbi:DNA-binding MarR family transcriptional regulator [Pseudomonas sp. JAI111]|uniref:MarR family winged helix-turn-helix transcriptional regulator n=1 Tax=Pseudomonas sp. JAI111 TaxID=2735913 RepID=UPI002169811E|nr:MarR family winged helix-turn-helix transcriptional regulator [Pseudomonas sp. JAI111]MCS3835714.1 DNA-binding MarR family transcriptional regulator [Pseudomonas sp. JAI111]